MSTHPPAFRSPITPDETNDPFGLLEYFGISVAVVAFSLVAVNFLVLQVSTV